MAGSGDVKVLVHDPALAYEVFRVFAGLAGRKDTGGAYHKWLREYVKPIARAMRSRGILFYDPYGDKRGLVTVTVKLPAWLYSALSSLARELGASKGAVIRFALALLLEALSSLEESENSYGGGSDGG